MTSFNILVKYVGNKDAAFKLSALNYIERKFMPTVFLITNKYATNFICGPCM